MVKTPFFSQCLLRSNLWYTVKCNMFASARAKQKVEKQIAFLSDVSCRSYSGGRGPGTRQETDIQPMNRVAPLTQITVPSAPLCATARGPSTPKPGQKTQKLLDIDVSSAPRPSRQPTGPQKIFPSSESH